jgi:hypothetical protein
MMVFEMERKNILVTGSLIILCIILYFLHSYLTKKLIHSELSKYKKKKMIRTKLSAKKQITDIDLLSDLDSPVNQKQQMQKYTPVPISTQDQDIDSYIDLNNQNDNIDKDCKLNPRNIMMRDIVDGSHN